MEIAGVIVRIITSSVDGHRIDRWSNKTISLILFGSLLRIQTDWLARNGASSGWQPQYRSSAYLLRFGIQQHPPSPQHTHTHIHIYIYIYIHK